MEERKIPQRAEDRPDIRYLNSHVRSHIITACGLSPGIWKDLGIELTMMGQDSMADINTISANNRGDVVGCCSSLFTLWLLRQPEANWKQLVVALIAIKLNALAAEIKKSLILSEQQQTSLDRSKEVVKIDSPPTFITTKHLDADFASLLLHICEVLNNSTNKNSSLEKCKKYCLLLPTGVNSNIIPLSNQKNIKIKECINFNQLLENIKEYMSWDEHSILDQIIGQCESPEAETEVNKFERKLALYQGLEIVCNTAEFKMSTEFVKFCLVINRPYKKLTVEEYIDIKAYIVRILGLNPCVLKNFCKLLYGSLHMEWLVSVEVIYYISKMVHQERDIIIKQDVVLMQIGEYVIIKEPTYRPITAKDWRDTVTQPTCSSAYSHAEMKVPLKSPIQPDLQHSAAVKPPCLQHKIFELKPLMHDLNRIVVPKVSVQWEDIAYALQYDIPTVEKISKKHEDNPTKCCKELFKNWLATDNGAKTKIWQTLMDKLKEIEELASVTEDIMERLIQMDPQA